MQTIKNDEERRGQGGDGCAESDFFYIYLFPASTNDMADILVVNGEVIWDGNDIAIVKGDADIKQQAYLRSITDFGEINFYSTYGSKIFLYLGKAFSKGNKGFAEQAARDAILAVEGIEEVLSIELKEVPRENSNAGGGILRGNPLNAAKEAVDIRRFDYYIFAEYKTENGRTLKGEFAYVAD